MIVGNEPNLNRFWLPQFNEDGTGASAPAYLALLAATYDAVKAAAPETIVWGGALAPRGVDKPGTGRDTISPTRFIREWGEAYRGERPHDPVHGRLRLPSLRRSTRARPSTCRRTTPTTSALVDQNKLVRLLGKAFDGTRTGRARGCRSSTTSTGSSRSCPRRRRCSTPAGSRRRRVPSTRRPRPPAYAQAIRLAYCQSNVAGILLFHAQRRDRPRRLAVGPLLPRRHAEVLARRRPRHDGRDRERRRSASARSRSGPSSRSRPAPVRSRSGATATASTAHGWCGCRPVDHGVEERTRAAAAAGSRSSSAPAWRPGATGSRSRSCTRRGPAPVVVRASAEFAVRSPLAALTLAGCGGGNDDAATSLPRRRGRRRRPPPRAGARPARGGRLRRRRDHELLAARALGAGRRRSSPCCRASPRAPARRGSSSASTTRLRDDAADARGAGAVRRVRRRDRARRPGDPRRDRRQRAEPEPLLAAAVRRGRERRRRAGLLRAAGRGVRRRQGGRRGRDRIWGGALAPRGIDRPGTGRDTHSPTTFIRDLGAAYRASGRDEPPLDGFAFHPYPASSSIPPDRPTDPDVDVDPDGRLRGEAAAAARRGVRARPARPLQRARRRDGDPAGEGGALRGRAEPGQPVDEATQADYYRRAIELAACQENVAGLLLFHSHDEPALTGFQSGVYYVDGTPKASFEPVRDAIRSAGC